MNRGLLHLLLCLVLAFMGTPAWAHCRPETRVGSSANFLPNFTFADDAKPVTVSGENPACGYDFASGVHKYLYAQDNPVNHIDPSGHDIEAGLTGTIVDLEISVGVEAEIGAAEASYGVAAESAGTGAAEEAIAANNLEEEEIEGELEAEELQADAGAESSQGEWVGETINNPQAEAYEQQVMNEVGGEARAGQAYKLNGVKFDGIDSGGSLIEAKGPGYAKLFKLPFADNVEQQIVEQMGRQIAARAGKQVVWHIAEQDAVPVFQQLVIRANAKGIIQIVLTPLTAP